MAKLESTLVIELLQDNIAIYYKGRKIPVIPLYATPFLHYVQYVAPYVAKRLVETGRKKFRVQDLRAAEIIQLACGNECVYAQDAEEVDKELEEAYYNHLAEKIVAYTISVDALVVPCADQPFAKALIRRAREYAKDLVIIASEFRGQCPQADIRHTPQPIDTPLPLGPVSRAALHTALWALEERHADAPLTPLLDAECQSQPSR
jgi:hypothetical protein